MNQVNDSTFVDPMGGLRVQTELLESKPEVSLLDHFAVHAPAEIPEWFKVKLLPLPQAPDYTAMVSGPEAKEAVRSWLNCEEDLPEHLRHVATASREYFDDLERVRQINREARYFKWRWYYAKQMLAYRPDDNGRTD